jgi:hypothetical protein
MKNDRPLEAVITAGLKNPGIVRTIAYSWLCHRDSRGLDEAAALAEAAESATPSPAASTAWDSANSNPRQSAREMWMLLEYCDRGCLVVRAAPRLRAAGPGTGRTGSVTRCPAAPCRPAFTPAPCPQCEVFHTKRPAAALAAAGWMRVNSSFCARDPPPRASAQLPAATGADTSRRRG